MIDLLTTVYEQRRLSNDGQARTAGFFRPLFLEFLATLPQGAAAPPMTARPSPRTRPSRGDGRTAPLSPPHEAVFRMLVATSSVEAEGEEVVSALALPRTRPGPEDLAALRRAGGRAVHFRAGVLAASARTPFDHVDPPPLVAAPRAGLPPAAGPPCHAALRIRSSCAKPVNYLLFGW